MMLTILAGCIIIAALVGVYAVINAINKENEE